jgi:L-amino acid N-acyltransferase YncA
MAVVLRLARETDAEALLAIYAPYVEETAISFETEPPSPEDFRGRIRTNLAHAPWLVCESDGHAVGYAYAARFHARAAYQWTVEVTVYVDRHHHRRRIGQGLYSALLDGVRAQGFRTAVGVIALPNPESVGLHERFDFRCAGVLQSVGFKHGRWHDIGWWALPLASYAPSPPAPLPTSAIVETAEWRDALARGAGLTRAG